MKNLLSILLSISLCAVLSLSALSFTASAADINRMSLTVKKDNDNYTVVSVILTGAEKAETVDFDLILSAEKAEIVEFSTKDTDTEKLAFDIENKDNKYNKKKNFVYTTTESDNKLSLTGYFVKALTTDKNFHLCDIIISNDGKFKKTDTIILEYNIDGADGLSSGSITYYPAKKTQDEATVNYENPMGDVNRDGKTSSDDARLILRASVGLDSLKLNEYPFADTDYDGKVTAADARFALRTAVGLEIPVMHRFIIILGGEKKNCEKGGTYTFYCELTGKTFNMEIKKGGHICPETKCYNSGKCIICSKKVQDVINHDYNDMGICSVCGADKKELKNIKSKLVPIIDEIRTYDLLADESLANYKKADFLSFVQDSALNLKKAAEICKGIKGYEDIYINLTKAYKLRFDAFVACMDENGEILSSSANCSTIQDTVHLSCIYLDLINYPS